MKSGRAEIHRGVHGVPQVRFDDHKMTSFSGLVVFQLLFKRLDLKGRLRRAFGEADRVRTFGLSVVVLQLVVQVLLGFRRLRDGEYFANDPLVLRVLGVSKLPDVATLSRTLAAATAKSFEGLREIVRRLVLERLTKLRLATVTLDFDGSVQSSRRHAEGSAIGYNKKRKGARSYYPLFCTVSETGQFLDMLHRPGNVHDSRDSETFIAEKVADVRSVLPCTRIETRLDSAFFSEQTLACLERLGVEYAVSAPFERFPELRRRIVRRTSGWTEIDATHAFIEADWRPKSRPQSDERRLIAVRTKRPQRIKGPLPVDPFEPRDHEYEYKVFVTNKTVGAGAAMLFHNGRGNQEATLGEGKHWAALQTTCRVAASLPTKSTRRPRCSPTTPVASCRWRQPSRKLRARSPAARQSSSSPRSAGFATSSFGAPARSPALPADSRSRLRPVDLLGEASSASFVACKPPRETIRYAINLCNAGVVSPFR